MSAGAIQRCRRPQGSTTRLQANVTPLWEVLHNLITPPRHAQHPCKPILEMGTDVPDPGPRLITAKEAERPRWCWKTRAAGPSSITHTFTPGCQLILPGKLRPARHSAIRARFICSAGCLHAGRTVRK